MALAPFAVFFLISLSLSFAAAAATSTVRAGYYLAADARLRPLASLDASLYTHLVYSALAVDPATRAPAVPADPGQACLLATFSWRLKSRNPALRTLLSVGASSAWSSSAPQTTTDPALAAAAADPSSRASFVSAALALAAAHGFDGLDLAWRLPSSAAEMAALGFLLADLRAAAPRGFLLTAAVHFSDHVSSAASASAGVDYPAEAMARCLDWVHVMAFGLGSPPSSVNATTAFDAPLYDRASHSSASYGVVSWADAGMPAAKLVVGLPLYGRSWVLRNRAHDGVGAPVVAAGPRQRGGTNITGVMSYAEVQRLAAAAGGLRVVTTTCYDNASVASYLSAGGVWVAFDGAAVVDEKIAFAVRRGLLGYFLWPVNYDDANFTVSRRALEAWMQSLQSSSNSRNGTGVRQAQAPVWVPPALHSPARTPGPMPAPTSGSCSWLPWRNIGSILHWGTLIILFWC